jgi:hypothetical protein
MPSSAWLPALLEQSFFWILTTLLYTTLKYWTFHSIVTKCRSGRAAGPAFLIYTVIWSIFRRYGLDDIQLRLAWWTIARYDASGRIFFFWGIVRAYLDQGRNRIFTAVKIRGHSLIRDMAMSTVSKIWAQLSDSFWFQNSDTIDWPAKYPGKKIGIGNIASAEPQWVWDWPGMKRWTPELQIQHEIQKWNSKWVSNVSQSLNSTTVSLTY